MVCGVTEEIINDIIRIIVAHKPVKKIILFGSRAVGDFTNLSDIEIAIVADAWKDRDIAHTKHALDEKIKTPLKFDVVHFDGIRKDTLRENIQKQGKVIYDKR